MSAQTPTQSGQRQALVQVSEMFCTMLYAWLKVLQQARMTQVQVSSICM